MKFAGTAVSMPAADGGFTMVAFKGEDVPVGTDVYVNKLKIYTQDWGWRGNVLVIATSEEAARKIMQDDHNYVADEPVEEHELIDGFAYGHDAS